MRKPIIQRDVISGQSKGCVLAVQVGFTRLLVPNLWPRDFHSGALVEIFIAAPSHNPRIGYRRRHFGIAVKTPFSRRRLRLSLGAGY